MIPLITLSAISNRPSHAAQNTRRRTLRTCILSGDKQAVLLFRDGSITRRHTSESFLTRTMAERAPNVRERTLSEKFLVRLCHRVPSSSPSLAPLSFMVLLIVQRAENRLEYTYYTVYLSRGENIKIL